MAEPVTQHFTRADVPRLYDEWLGPRVFQPWARELLRVAALQPGEAVLDVACGPGTVARIAAEQVGAAGSVSGADLSAAMIAQARAVSAAIGAAAIDYIESPAAPLAVPSEAFDVAVCQQGLQFMPDPLAALREMWRALRAGGRVAVAVWGYRGPIPETAIVAKARELGIPPKEPERFGADPNELMAVLSDASFVEVHVEPTTLEVVFEGGADQLIGMLPVMPFGDFLNGLAVEQREAILSAWREELERYVRDGELRYGSEANIAWGKKGG